MKARTLLMVLVLVASALVRGREHLGGGVHLDHDWYAMHLADAVHVERAQAEGHWTATWSPWLLGGTPLFGVATKPFSYPPFLIAVAAFGAIGAMNVLLLVHLALASVGTAFLARRLGLREPAPLLAGLLVVWGPILANGFANVPFGTGQAVAWWPFAMMALLDLLERETKAWAGARLGVFTALQVHAGGEPTLYWFACFSAAFCVPWCFVRDGSWIGRLRGLVVAVLVFLGATAVRWLPELAWIAATGRAEGLDASRTHALSMELGLGKQDFAAPLQVILEQLWERYHEAGALVLLVGSALALVRWIRVRPLHLPLAGLVLGSAVAFVISTGLLHETFHAWLPGYDRMRHPTRFFQVAAWGAVLVAAHGFSFEGRHRVWIGAALLAFLVVDVRGLWLEAPPPLHSPAARAAATDELMSALPGDSGPTRFYQAAHTNQSRWIELGCASAGGALGGPFSRHRRLTALVGEHRPALALQREVPEVLDVLGVDWLLSSRPLEAEGLQLEQGPEELTPRALRELRSAGLPTHVYRRTTARPRAVVVDSPRILEQGELSCEAAQVRSLPAGCYRFTERGIEVDVDGEEGEYLVLADTCALYPGWTARVDGRVVPLRIADRLATAIPLLEGAKRVELNYRSPGMGTGAMVTGATLVLLLLAGIVRLRGSQSSPLSSSTKNSTTIPS